MRKRIILFQICRKYLYDFYKLLYLLRYRLIMKQTLIATIQYFWYRAMTWRLPPTFVRICQKYALQEDKETRYVKIIIDRDIIWLCAIHWRVEKIVWFFDRSIQYQILTLTLSSSIKPPPPCSWAFVIYPKI